MKKMFSYFAALLLFTCMGCKNNNGYDVVEIQSSSSTLAAILPDAKAVDTLQHLTTAEKQRLQAIIKRAEKISQTGADVSKQEVSQAKKDLESVEDEIIQLNVEVSARLAAVPDSPPGSPTNTGSSCKKRCSTTLDAANTECAKKDTKKKRAICSATALGNYGSCMVGCSLIIL